MNFERFFKILESFLLTIRCVTFCIPAIACIVGHFVGHVLSKSKLLLIDTTFGHEQKDSRNEITKRFVVDQFLQNILIQKVNLDAIHRT